jgi:copper(I)-binding protein
VDPKALKTAFAAPVLMGLALGLSACADEADAPVEAPREGSVPDISITDARLVLNAVEGNPAAVYFNLSYDGEKGLAVRDARVEGAGDADVHAVMEYDGRMQMNTANPIPLTTGTEVAFEPGGLHIMAFEPSGALTPAPRPRSRWSLRAARLTNSKPRSARSAMTKPGRRGTGTDAGHARSTRRGNAEPGTCG